jgi:hypothetical protein
LSKRLAPIFLLCGKGKVIGMSKKRSNKRDDVLDLNQKTERNYEAAKNYYKQKRLNFFKIMSKQNDQKFLEKLMTKFQDTIEKKISAK